MNKKKTMLIISAIAVFVLLCSVMYIVYTASLTQPDDGKKLVTVTVTYKDGSTKEFTSKTEKDYLSDVLVELGLVTEETKTFFDTVDGVKADYSVDGSYWSIVKDGIECVLGANELAITDGCKYEIKYTIFDEVGIW